MIDAGEEIDLTIRFANTMGSVESENGYVEITTDNPNVDVINDYIGLPYMEL